jgi:hypothetical protein
MLPEPPGSVQPWSARPRPGSAAEAASRLISELSAGAPDAVLPPLDGEPGPVVPAAATPEPPPVARRAPGTGRARRGNGRLLVLVSLAVLLLGGYLVRTQVLDAATVPAAVPSALPSPSASTPSAALAAALRDPHFRHGYDAGVRRARVAPVPAADRGRVCWNLGLAERTRGYPWGAHDLAGCVTGVTPPR